MLSRINSAKKAAGAKARDSVSVSGPDYYGMSHEHVASIVEGLHGALQCNRYVFLAHRQGNWERKRAADDSPATVCPYV